MKISLKWLNEFVDVNEYFERPQQLAHLLTTAGLEAEEIHDLSAQYKYVKTALILEKEKHPDAEKLTVCKVTTGEGVVHQIVCGAKNHKAQDRVILALPGAILPGHFAIKNSVIRGISSEGMLCSYKELGLEDSSDGIAILPENTPIGVDFSTFAELNDVTFELKVTPNRADCLSHIGLAREIACLLNRPFKTPEPKIQNSLSLNSVPILSSHKSVSETISSRSSQSISVEVNSPDMCPRYSGCVITGVKVGPSPLWLKKRLEIVGLNSINNVVDITNYVMIEWGQPLHAFDLKHIQNAKIVVTYSTKQEKFITLDGSTLTLQGEELMIQDSKRSLCMAGVIGGKNSGVQDDTVDIFLESAFFAPQFIRRSARGHGISTDSGYRFSRGVDPNVTLEGLKRAIQLICEVAGGTLSTSLLEVKSKEFHSTPIKIKIELVTERLGYPVEKEKFESWMQRLGCKMESNGNDYIITPPSWRFDLEMDMDLVEEYARLNGYEFIPETLPALFKAPAKHDINYLFKSHLIELMTSMGYSQAVNFAFVSQTQQNEFINDTDLLSKAGFQGSHQPIPLMNPLNDHMNVMRMSLSMSLIGNLHHNFHHGVTSGRLFEVGSVFDQKNGQYHERTHWAGIAWGWVDNLWTKNLQTPVVMDLKQSIEEVLLSLGFKDWKWLKSQEVGRLPSFLHPGQSVALQLNGKKIGFLGTLHPALLDEKKIRCDCAIFELEMEALTLSINRKWTIKPISKFQSVDRDLSLVMPKDLGSGVVLQAIQKAGGSTLFSTQIVDLYEGEKLGVGLKSVTYRLRFQELERTLTDAQVQSSIESILVSIKKHWEIQVR